MNLKDIAKDQTLANLLSEGNWQQADFYDLDSNDGNSGRTLIVKLSKSVTSNAEEALIYLIQKQTKALGIWEREWENVVPSVKELIDFFIAEKGVSNASGKILPTEGVLENIKKHLQGLQNADGFECSKNGVTTIFQNFFTEEKIMQVVCFDDEWNEQNLFIEMENIWVLYHWSLGI